MSMNIMLLREGDENVLRDVAPGVFDHDVEPILVLQFLGDPRHHIAVAVDNGVVVGMASGVHYVHPDKHPELWINEIGVAPDYRGQGLAKSLMHKIMQEAKRNGCKHAWVLTDRDNTAAMKLYAAVGGVEAEKDQVMFTIPCE